MDTGGTECPACEGHGFIIRPGEPTTFDHPGYPDERVECPRCGGVGAVTGSETDCVELAAAQLVMLRWVLDDIDPGVHAKNYTNRSIDLALGTLSKLPAFSADRANSIAASLYSGLADRVKDQ